MYHISPYSLLGTLATVARDITLRVVPRRMVAGAPFNSYLVMAQALYSQELAVSQPPLGPSSALRLLGLPPRSQPLFPNPSVELPCRRSFPFRDPVNVL